MMALGDSISCFTPVSLMVEHVTQSLSSTRDFLNKRKLTALKTVVTVLFQKNKRRSEDPRSTWSVTDVTKWATHVGCSAALTREHSGVPRALSPGIGRLCERAG